MVFAGFLKILTRGGGIARLFAPEVGVSHFLCAQGVGILPFKKIPRVFPWGMVRLGYDIMCTTQHHQYEENLSKDGNESRKLSRTQYD